jgi:ATP-dependent RNA helicase DDX42
MKRKIEGFAREILKEPVRVVVGSIGQANADVRQKICVLRDETCKWACLVDLLPSCLEEGKVMIFVNAKVMLILMRMRIN